MTPTNDPMVAEIHIALLADSSVRVQARCAPGFGELALLGLLRRAEMDLLAKFTQQREQKIMAPPPGLNGEKLRSSDN